MLGPDFGFAFTSEAPLDAEDCDDAAGEVGSLGCREQQPPMKRWLIGSEHGCDVTIDYALDHSVCDDPIDYSQLSDLPNVSKSADRVRGRRGLGSAGTSC